MNEGRPGGRSGHNHRDRQEVRQHRDRSVQEPSEMDRPNDLRDTVANTIAFYQQEMQGRSCAQTR
jgi:hypothetical protein